MEQHCCEGYLPNEGADAALNFCSEQADQELWVGNGEYFCQVNFCPYCGYKAKVQLKKFVEQRSEEYIKRGFSPTVVIWGREEDGETV